MKTFEKYFPLIFTAIMILAAVFAPFIWLRIVFIAVLVIVWLSKIIIYMLRFKPETLKRWFPKYKWHIQRLHEIYIKK